MIPLLTLVLILFLIINPLGNITLFDKAVAKVPASRRRKVIARELLIALFTMYLFNFFGEYLFTVLGLSELTVRFASGIILFLIALRMLFPPEEDALGQYPEGEPFVVPLAIPLTAGPSLLGTIMLYAHIVPSTYDMALAIFIAWSCAAVLLLMGPQLEKLLRKNGLLACERLMGLVLILLATQRFMEGIQMMISQNS